MTELTSDPDLERDRAAGRDHVVGDYTSHELRIPGVSAVGRPVVIGAETDRSAPDVVAVPRVKPVLWPEHFRARRWRLQRRPERGRRRVHRQEAGGGYPVAAVDGHARVLAWVAALRVVDNQLS